MTSSASYTMKPLLGWLVVLGVVLSLVAGLAFAQGSRGSFADRRGRLVAAELSPSGGDRLSVFQELTLRSSTGLEVHALLRRPRGSRAPHAAIVLVGGLKQGRRVGTIPGLEPIARHAVIAALDYPLRFPRRAWEGGQLVSTLLHLRPAALDTIAHTLLLLDYLESRDDVDGRRLFLVGGSLGAVVVTIAGGVDPRPAAIVALYGGGQLGSLITHTLEHRAQDVPYSHWAAILAGHGLSWLFMPLAPERYAPAIAPHPFLMVNGTDDSLVPRDNVFALYRAARPPKDLIWVESEHVQPEEGELIGHLSGTVTAWLTERGLLPNDRAAPR